MLSHSRRSDIEVVLATYQGARFLAPQLQSIANQQVRPVRVQIGDDGSTDGTVTELAQWASTAPFPIHQLPCSRTGPLGPAANFGRLLAATTAPWVALCDQDDVWHPSKLDRLLGRLPEDDQIPTLFVHDLRVVNRTDDLIAGSFWRHQRFTPRGGARFSTLLVMNSFPGCAMLANRALLTCALPVPSEAVMHDWWLALVAAACGRIIVVNEALGDYRLHGNNVLGAPTAGWWSRIRERRWFDRRGQALAMRQCLDQATAMQACGLPLSATARVTLDRFLACLDGPNWRRPFALWRNGNIKTYWPRNLRFLAGSLQAF